MWQAECMYIVKKNSELFTCVASVFSTCVVGFKVLSRRQAWYIYILVRVTEFVWLDSDLGGPPWKLMSVFPTPSNWHWYCSSIGLVEHNLYSLKIRTDILKHIIMPQFYKTEKQLSDGNGSFRKKVKHCVQIKHKMTQELLTVLHLKNVAIIISTRFNWFSFLGYVF